MCKVYKNKQKYKNVYVVYQINALINKEILIKDTKMLFIKN